MLRSFLTSVEIPLLMMSASDGQKTRHEADKRNVGPDVLGVLADIHVATMPKSLAQAWLLGFRLKDNGPLPGAS
jgi:hypothetical protein